MQSVYVGQLGTHIEFRYLRHSQQLADCTHRSIRECPDFWRNLELPPMCLPKLPVFFNEPEVVSVFTCLNEVFPGLLVAWRGCQSIVACSLVRLQTEVTNPNRFSDFPEEGPAPARTTPASACKMVRGVFLPMQCVHDFKGYPLSNMEVDMDPLSPGSALPDSPEILHM